MKRGFFLKPDTAIDLLSFMRLNISDFILDMELSGLDMKSREEIYSLFSTFVSHNGNAPHETLEVIQCPPGRKKETCSELEGLIRDSIKIPLAKFPFSTDPDKEINYTLKKIKAFIGHKEFNAFLEGAKDPELITFYIFKKGCLVRRLDSARSALFLKPGCRRRSKIAGIYGAAYFSVSLGLPTVDGIMLHGVGINRKGAGYLFLGTSGAGKTTMARLCGLNQVVTDDGIIVKRNASGFSIAPTPFNQLTPMDNNDMARAVRGHRLVMGLFLKKDAEVYLERISPLEACSLILKNHIHYFRYFPSAIARKAFPLVTDLCREVPFFRLHFRKDAGFWELVESEVQKTFGFREIYHDRKREQETAL